MNTKTKVRTIAATITTIGSLVMGANAQTVNNFNGIWDVNTGTGTTTLGGTTINMSLDPDTGTKLFTSTNQPSSLAVSTHGGVPGSILFGGNGEDLNLQFSSTVDVILGLSQLNIYQFNGDPLLTDGWGFTTPASSIVSLAANHTNTELTSLLTANTSPQSNQTISYVRWNNVSVIDLETLGDNSTSIGLSSIQIVPEPSSTALLGLGALGLLIRRKR